MERRLTSQGELRELIAEIFDHFAAPPITPEGRLAEGFQTGEVDEIENYFRVRRWPDLINYFQRWDVSLSSASFLTDIGFELTLPAFLVASVLWPDKLDTGVLMSILLAPECKRGPCSEYFSKNSGLSPQQLASIDDERKRLFAKVHRTLTQRQRGLVGRTLKHLVDHGSADGDAECFESYTGLTNTEVLVAIQDLWEKTD